MWAAPDVATLSAIWVIRACGTHGHEVDHIAESRMLWTSASKVRAHLLGRSAPHLRSRPGCALSGQTALCGSGDARAIAGLAVAGVASIRYGHVRGRVPD